MDPLQALLRPVAVLINRQIATSTPARELCVELEGRVVAVRVRDSALAAYFHVHSDRIDLTGVKDEDPDVVITGSLLSLAKLGGSGAIEAIRDGSVELHGDARTAQAFQLLLFHGKPDLEEELAGIIGDSAAHGIGEFSRRFKSWGEDAARTMSQNVGEYLQEESDAVPSRGEMAQFRKDVGRLRDDVARLEARLALFDKQDEQ